MYAGSQLLITIAYQICFSFAHYSKLPSFDSVFDEETFYIFFFILVIVSCIAAYIASKFITLEDASFAEIEAKKKM